MRPRPRAGVLLSGGRGFNSAGCRVAARVTGRLWVVSGQPKLAPDLVQSGGLAGTVGNLTQRSGDTTMVALWWESVMATTLTLKNIPDEVYARLKRSAEVHRRSMNSEAIVCLEAVLLPERVTPAERLARARELRAALSTAKFRARDIDRLKRQGRA